MTKTIKESLQIFSFVLLCLLVVFWVAVSVYCVGGYLKAGPAGLWGWLIHVSPQWPSDPTQFGPPSDPRVRIAVRLGILLLITAGLVFINLPALRKLRSFWKDW